MAKEEATTAADASISLSQALLAPLDAIFKAQTHAARSFVNLLMQVGFPHREPNEPPTAWNEEPYRVEFPFDLPDGTKQRVRVPTLALIPVKPLGIESAKFDFEFFVRAVARHKQLRESAGVGEDDRSKRPWFLVDDPQSLRGTFAPASADDEESQQQARIRIHIEMKSFPPPAALERVMASLSQAVVTVPPEATLPPPPPAPPPAPENP